MKRYLIIFSLLSTFLTSCHLDHVEDADRVCVKKWSVNKLNTTGNLSSSIINGSLKISANSLITGENVQFSQSYLKGDFNSQIKFDNFTTGLTSDSTKAFFEFYITDSLGKTATAKINNKALLIYVNDTLKSTKSFNNNGLTLSGTFKINRTGSDLYIELIGNSTSPLDGSTLQNVLQINLSGFSNTKSLIGFGLGADQSINKQISINVSEFDLTNGGNDVKSDAFDCNSVKY